MDSCFVNQAIERKAKLTIAAFMIDIYIQQEASLFCVANPLQVRMELASRSHCAFLALGGVRTFLFAGWQLDEADKNERKPA